MSHFRRQFLYRSDPLPRNCRARDLIRDFYSGPVTLGDCAQEAGLSQWHFLRSFRAVFGETPKEFHTRLRSKRPAEPYPAQWGCDRRFAQQATRRVA